MQEILAVEENEPDVLPITFHNLQELQILQEGFACG